MLRWMYEHTRMDKIRNEYIKEKVGIMFVEKKLRETHLRWHRHVHR